MPTRGLYFILHVESYAIQIFRLVLVEICVLVVDWYWGLMSIVLNVHPGVDSKKRFSAFNGTSLQNKSFQDWAEISKALNPFGTRKMTRASGPSWPIHHAPRSPRTARSACTKRTYLGPILKRIVL